MGKGKKKKKFEVEKSGGIKYVVEQRNAYLDKLGLKPHEYGTNFSELSDWKHNRKKRRKEKKKYGFDSRETWCMDSIFIQWLYSHLKMYKETAGKVIDLTFHKYEFDGKEYTQEEAIDQMIEWCEFCLVHCEDDDSDVAKDAYNKAEKAAGLWAKFLLCMNW